MAFDSDTRSRLARFVADARTIITREFTQKLQERYGIQPDGSVVPVDKLTDLDEVGRATAVILRDRIDYLVRSHPEERDAATAAVTRLTREQAFTVLNRFAALRMAEKRGLIVESVGRGYQSRGFKTFETVAGTGLGDAYHRYRRYLFCLFDEFAVDLGVLFDRHSPQGLLFPREKALLEILEMLNAPDIEELWAEDETIGWIYQYYNDPAERKKMRDASSAPRNSRELAVRNQFFTPRYVVEFLTDNTLGRLWYEMTRGETALRDRCRYLVRRPTEIFLNSGEVVPTASDNPQSAIATSQTQEDLLRAPVHIPHRPLKDPREIRLLDPACGSMHFGLYAFDLFEVIYSEAWDMAKSGAMPASADKSASDFCLLTSDFSSKEAFLRQVPRLIVEHNIHGIDIDPRAAQIAGLSLWLRAQRAWHQAGVKSADRPRITRSNLVCAEPMPGEKELLREFIEQQFPAGERPAFAFLLERIFDRMTLAGEAGSLLRIEQEIRAAIADARALARRQSAPRQTALWAGDERPEQTEFDLRGLNDEQFWQAAEQRIYNALEAYAEQTEHGGGFQRRLFADDAAQGFAFIDLCRRRYDVVVMNPPYGEFAGSTKELLDADYPTSKNDLYACFVERGLHLLDDNARLGALTSRTFLNISSLIEFRKLLLDATAIEALIDLGFDVLDGAVVETCAYTLQTNGWHQRSWCARLVGYEEKAAPLSDILHLRISAAGALFLPNQDDMLALPNHVFAYWLPTDIQKLFTRLPAMGSVGFEVKLGLQTGDNDRFLRLRWEIPSDNTGYPKCWVNYAKGGDFSPFHDDIHLAVNWGADGAEIKAMARAMYGSETRTVKCQEFYLRRGLTYPLVTVKGINVRLLPEMCICDNGGPGVYCTDAELLWSALAVTNSRAFQALLGCLTTSRHWQVGYVAKVPFAENTRNVARLARNCFHLRRSLDTNDETTNSYIGCLSSLDSTSSADTARQLTSEFAALDSTVASLYGLETETKFLDDEVGQLDLGNTVLSLRTGLAPSDHFRTVLSSAFGCALGRWDIRYATGEHPAPELPDPFAPLPVCPPGMLQGDDGLPLPPEAGRRLRTEGRYPLDVAWDGILVDDPEHPLDLERRIHAALAIIWSDRTDALEHEACALLGVPTLRDWFRRPTGFFADHLKRYSKSRRQAPIYWPLSTASGSYTLWIYYHRLTDQTLHTALADFLDPKIRSVQATLAAQRSEGRSQKAGESQEFLDELLDLRAEIERVIKLPWKPNLNDGVLITAAPLWKLFRLPKWQKDLKACWDELANGDYDWAHLAYSIWPKRVEKLCETDRSIAIAHGLEHLCKVEPPKPKKKRGKKSLKNENLELEETE